MVNKPKVMISQPMRNKTVEEIEAIRAKAIERLTMMGYEVIDTFMKDYHQKYDGSINRPVFCLGESIKKMAECRAVYFVTGWEEARGCRIEHTIATEYGLNILDEKAINDELAKNYGVDAPGLHAPVDDMPNITK